MSVIIYEKTRKMQSFRAPKKNISLGSWWQFRSTSELRFLSSDSEERSNMAEQRVPGRGLQQLGCFFFLFFGGVKMDASYIYIYIYMLFERKCSEKTKGNKKTHIKFSCQEVEEKKHPASRILKILLVFWKRLTIKEGKKLIGKFILLSIHPRCNAVSDGSLFMILEFTKTGLNWRQNFSTGPWMCQTLKEKACQFRPRNSRMLFCQTANLLSLLLWKLWLPLVWSEVLQVAWNRGLNSWSYGKSPRCSVAKPRISTSSLEAVAEWKRLT